jgi:hypothetical protein
MERTGKTKHKGEMGEVAVFNGTTSFPQIKLRRAKSLAHAPIPVVPAIYAPPHFYPTPHVS